MQLGGKVDIRALSNGYQGAAVLFAALELGLFEALEKGSYEAAELASQLGLELRGIEVILDALVTLTLLHKEGGRYSNSEEASRFLLEAAPQSLVAILKHRALVARRWMRLAETVKRGLPVDEGPSVLRDEAANRSFIKGMAQASRSRIAPVLAQLPLAEVEVMVDIGGGPAVYLCEALRGRPKMRGILVDLPLTLGVAAEEIEARGMTGRIDLVACDFYHEPLSLQAQADLVLVSQVLHAEGPKENQALLQRIARIVAPGGHLAVVENMVQHHDRSRPAAGALFAVNMLAGTERGRTYSAEEISQWMEAAGLEVGPCQEISERTQMVVGGKPML